MSFVKKAVKKVFKVVKKVVKSKVFKWVAIAAAVFFTAGIAAGGFTAFAGVNSVGAFFTAVGQTMATGAGWIASSIGMKGTGAWLGSHGGAAGIQAGLTTTATSATGAALVAAPGMAGQAAGAIAATGGTNAAAVSGGYLKMGGSIVGLSAKGAAAAAAQTTIAGGAGLGLPGSSPLLKTTPALMGAATKSGISPVVWQGISVAATSVLTSRNRKNAKQGPTFIPGGGLSKGSAPEDFQPHETYVVGGARGRNAQQTAEEEAAAQANVSDNALLAQESGLGINPVGDTPEVTGGGGVNPAGILAGGEEGMDPRNVAVAQSEDNGLLNIQNNVPLSEEDEEDEFGMSVYDKAYGVV